MQNVDTRKFQSYLSDKGYKPVRRNGSHVTYERTVTDSVTIPVGNKTICGAMAKRLQKHVEKFGKETEV